jgi:tRNA (guanosine-2'-O-)-methyltransferase
MPSDPVVAAREMQRLLSSGPRTSFDPEWFRFGDATLTPSEVVAILRPHLTDRRAGRIERVLDERTYHLTVVVEGMVDSGNVSAVMRTADGFGVQAFHAIDTASSYKHSRRTSQGAEKWLDRYRWRTVDECVGFLRAAGYRIVAAHPDETSQPIEEVDLAAPSALVFGNELAGLSDGLAAAADVRVRIPLSGFVQSFNISVAAALCLYRARRDRITRLGAHGDLLPADRERLRAVFTMKSVRNHEAVVRRVLDQGIGAT